MKKFLLLLGSVLFMNAYGQRTCGTTQKAAEHFANNPVAQANRESLRNFLTTNDYSQSRKAGVITIPVVVHIIYKNATQNISDAQIASQIKILNDDFRKLNADFNTVVPAAFKPMAADLELAFCLATKKPDGSTTTGVERKSVVSGFNFDNNYYKSTGLLAWDPTKYLNIWVGAFTDQGLLGWALPPDFAGDIDDGLCIGYQYFGNTGPVVSPYNKGRTATHEIGHYFGLNHIWGDSNSATVCGTAINNDGCADTPATKEPYFGTPTFPTNQYTCTTTANGAMFMNYMDYVNDAAMAMFSNDQKTITQNTMVGPRASLLNSNACTTTLGVNSAEKINAINVFPNPAVNYISVASPLVKISEVEIFGNDGRLVKKANVKNETDKIDVKSLPVGTYYIRTYGENGFVKSLKFIKK